MTLEEEAAAPWKQRGARGAAVSGPFSPTSHRPGHRNHGAQDGEGDHAHRGQPDPPPPMPPADGFHYRRGRLSIGDRRPHGLA